MRFNKRLIKYYLKSKKKLNCRLVLTLLLISFIFIGCNVTKAIESNNIENIQKIISQGGDVNHKVSGHTRLHLAVAQKDKELVMFLVKNGADVNKKSFGGIRPMDKAILDNNIQMVNLLLEKGANINYVAAFGKTPIETAESEGFKDIVKLLKGDTIINSKTLDSEILNVEKIKIDSKADSLNNNLTKDKDGFTYVSFIKPIPTWIGPTKFPGSDVFNPKNYNISTWGIGIGFQKNMYKNINILADFSRYSFKQDLMNEGESDFIPNTINGELYYVPFPLGVKYKTLTNSFRLGLKYTFKKSKVIQPWIGLAYGMNFWEAKYLTSDEKKVYGEAKGIKLRHALLAGIDIRMEEVGIITIFFDAVSPVAEFTMKNLFGLGDYHQFDATTYPSPRIGISIGVFN